MRASSRDLLLETIPTDVFPSLVSEARSFNRIYVFCAGLSGEHYENASRSATQVIKSARESLVELTRKDARTATDVQHDGVLEDLRSGQDKTSISNCTGCVLEHQLVNVCEWQAGA